ncbi:MAG TPA: N-acetylmuramoyl-L-alanine amidase [Chthoniobacteraceae bacterium]|jgi:N-acetylmuramoyl-L-alanine amidase|nr:N-acetylmuramoyl-L-alanine amidase [Chthoniobacteraceae bacterium]
MRSFRFFLLAMFLLLAVGANSSAAVRTVVIDAGHGGHDRGGGPGQRIPEKGYVLDISKRLEKELRARGFHTVMTRSGDYFVPLGTRCAIANRQRGAVLVSVHLNSGQREGANGIETYYYGGSSGALASAIHGRVLRAAGTEDRRVRRRGFFVLRNTRIPAVLCELGFLTNRAEAARLLTGGHRQRLAEAIAEGVTARYR